MKKFKAFLTERKFIRFAVLTVLLLAVLALIFCNDIATNYSQAETNPIPAPLLSSSDGVMNNSIAETTTEAVSLIKSQIIDAAPNEYSWTSETYEETPTAWIQYPVIYGMKDTAMEKNINRKIVTIQ